MSETQFVSKRNKVFNRRGQVVKVFANHESAMLEAELLRKYYNAGLDVPQVLECRKNELIMEYIPGETIPDFLARMEKEPDEEEFRIAARGLCYWLARFYEIVDHAHSGEIRGDVNGRNFLFTKNGVYSVDFEERAYGPIERDIGRLLAFIRTYDFNEAYAKRRLARLFTREAETRLPISKKEVLKHFRVELAEMKKRRKKTL